MPSHESPAAAGDRGAAVVEAALVLPVFLSLVLGMFTGGIIANRNIEVTHAAREGARYGALLPVDEEFSSGTWATTVRDLVVSRSEGQLEPSDICVALVEGVTPAPVSTEHATSSSGDACFDDSDAGKSHRRVQVIAETSGRLEAIVFSKDVDITATVTARHEELA